MQLSALHLVVTQNLIQEFRKDRICSMFEKEMIGWRDRAHNDVPTRCSFRKPASLEHIVDGIQIITAAGKRPDRRISSSGIVGIGQNDLEPEPAWNRF